MIIPQWCFRSIICVGLVFSCGWVFGQSDEDLAMLDYYMNQGDCERAALYYGKIEKTSLARKYFKPYLACLIEMNQIKEAKKLIKDNYKRSSDRVAPLYEEGRLNILIGEQKEGEALFQQAIEECQPQKGWVSRLAGLFKNDGYNEFALATYVYWSDKLEPPFGFFFERANLLGSMGRFEEMVDAYLNLVVENPAYKGNAQSAFLRYLDFEEDEESRELLKERLLLFRQKHADNPGFSDLLIWYFMSVKEFRPAFVQLRAAISRTGTGEEQMLQLARQAYKFQELEIAMQALDFLEKRPHMAGNLRSDLTGLRLLVELENSEDLELWQAQVREFLAAYPRSLYHLQLLREFYNFQNNKVHPDTAKQTLEWVLASSTTDERTVGLIQLWLGDWWLENGDVWEAGLLYGQVERRFKEDELGGEAKFRSALISYYTGDFEWTQAQLKVLKASTSKRMSNDALELGILISDNLGLDSIDVPLLEFARADLMLKQRKWEEARKTYAQIISDFPEHSLEDEIWYRFYELDFKAGNRAEAIGWLEKIRATHSEDLFGDNAVFQLGVLAEEMGELDKARQYYLELLKDHSDSFFTDEARKRLRKIENHDHL